MAYVRIGFLVNPIAGMGGRVGLKGTDGMVERARTLGARPVAGSRADETLRALRQLLAGAPADLEVHWLTCSGAMGSDLLDAAGYDSYEVVVAVADETTADDTRAAVEQFAARGVDLVLFCGGDGTARDVCDACPESTPVLGIPAGVKMFSGVFGTSPVRTADVAFAFLTGEIALSRADVADLDEDRYRRGEWAVKRHLSALTPYEPAFTQSAKVLIEEGTDSQAREQIALHCVEQIRARPETLFLLGPGSTVASVAAALGVDGTLLGVDAIAGGALVGKDLDEHGIVDLMDRYPSHALIVSPIGAQGFVLGRGNLQLSPAIVRRIGLSGLVVIATPLKLARTPVLRFDTGDPALDAQLVGKGYIAVIIGYRLERLVKAAI